jgi:hypothetical protein
MTKAITEGEAPLVSVKGFLHTHTHTHTENKDNDK